MFLLLFDNLTTLPDYTIPHPACELRFQLIFHHQQYPAAERQKTAEELSAKEDRWLELQELAEEIAEASGKE